MSRPKFVYFDLGNVLLTFSHERACRQMAAVSGVPWERIWDFVFGTKLEDQYERGEITSADFYRHFCREMKCQPPLAELLLAASDIFAVNQPVLPIASALCKACIPLGILSNTNDAHWNYCVNRFRILQIFSVRALSYELGSMKPEPMIYERAAELCGHRPPEIFFVDDREDNVAGAKAAGFDAVRFTTGVQLAKDLQSRGVEFNF